MNRVFVYVLKENHTCGGKHKQRRVSGQRCNSARVVLERVAHLFNVYRY
jgi:hypothetical protein